MISVIDLFVAIGLLIGIRSGYKNAFIIEFISFGIFLVGVFLSNLFVVAVARVFPRFNLGGQYMMIILFLLALVAVLYFAWMVEKIIAQIITDVKRTLPMRLIGMGINMTKVFLACSIFLILFTKINDAKGFVSQEMMDKSIFYEPLIQLGPLIFHFLHQYEINSSFM